MLFAHQNCTHVSALPGLSITFLNAKLPSTARETAPPHFLACSLASSFHQLVSKRIISESCLLHLVTVNAFFPNQLQLTDEMIVFMWMFLEAWASTCNHFSRQGTSGVACAPAARRSKIMGTLPRLTAISKASNLLMPTANSKGGTLGPTLLKRQTKRDSWSLVRTYTDHWFPRKLHAPI